MSAKQQPHRESAGTAASRFASLETRFDSFVTTSEQRHTELTNALNRFADNVDRRFNQIETEQQQAIQKFNDEQRTQGKVNWPALGVLLGAVTGLAVLYVSPLKDNQAAADARNSQNLRDVREFATEQAKGVRDQLTARLDVTDQRVNDVTGRVDRRADRDSDALNEYRRAEHPPATK